jgi:hypothetical protein
MDLLITPQELTEQTIIGGNVDYNKYVYVVENTQLLMIKPLLGNELFLLMFDNPTGVYLELLNDFVKPITKYASVANYLNVANYTVGNSGISKLNPENAEIASESETKVLASNYMNMAQAVIIELEKFLCKNHIPEYKNRNNKNFSGGWHL